jgi:nicotinamidase-related amidase
MWCLDWSSYVNDNFSRWRSDFAAQVRHCLDDNVRGRPIAELLQPDEEDYFVLKPKHSGFYSTCMEVLLSHLQVRRLILTGLAGNIAYSSRPVTPTCAIFNSSSLPIASARIRGEKIR